MLFSHPRTEGSQGRGVPWPNGLLWQVNGTWVGHLHTGAPTPQLSNLYPDLSHPLLIIAKTASRKRKLWEKKLMDVQKNSRKVETLSRTGLSTSLAHHNPRSLEILTNNFSQH